MKTLVLAMSILLSLESVALPALAASTEISVSGTGSVALAPNVATVSASVQTFSQDASTAVARNSAIYDRVVASLTKLGIARTDVTLSSYNVSYQPKTDDANVRPGYTVSRDFDVKVREIGKAGAVSDACTAAGATGINGVSFGVADPAPARAEATAKAVDDARRAADALAAAAHLHVVSIKSIDLGEDGGVRPLPMMRMAAGAGAPTRFDQANVNVTVVVTMTFLAEP
jgi:uncharacterized protein YggE